MIALLGLVGVRGWIAAGIAAALAFPAGMAAGQWREAARTDLKIEAAVRDYQLRQEELEDALLDRANRARRDAELGGLPDDDPFRRD